MQHPSRRIFAHHASPALNCDVFLAAGCIGWQRDFKLYRRAHLKRGIGANVNPGGAQVARYSTRIARGILLKGATLAELQAEAVWLVGLMLVAMTVAVARFRRTLD